MWTHGLLSALMQLPDPDPQTPYEPLPNGANMRVSIRRTLCVGELSGTPVEDLGVVPGVRHRLTQKDLLSATWTCSTAPGRSSALPVRRLSVDGALVGGTLTVTLETAQLDRVDLYLDRRAVGSCDVTTGAGTCTVERVSAGQRLRAEGLSGSELVAARKVGV